MQTIDDLLEVDLKDELGDVQLEQARLLNQKAPESCRSVLIIILALGGAMWTAGFPRDGMIWVALASAMVVIVFWYAWRIPAEAITQDSATAYLDGHTLISGITGLLWGGFACYHTRWEEPVTIIIAGVMTMIITVGGFLPGAVYRRESVVLAAGTLIPFSLYILLTIPGPFRFFGIASLVYYGLCLTGSAQATGNTRDGILARRAKALTIRLREQSALIQKAYEEKNRFLAATSHDLSQPLHAQGYFIKALRQRLDKQDQIDLLDKIEKSWRAQNELLNGLIDITRIDSGAVIPKFQPLDLTREVTALLSEFEEVIKEKALTLQTEYTDLQVSSDPLLLARVLRNLLSNAVKFTPRDGTVTVKTSHSDTSAIVTISDTGRGIPEDKQADIFDEYVQLGNDNRDRTKGLGLGLSIVKRLVQRLGLDLSLHSIEGQGTTLTLTLPMAESEASLAPQRPVPHGSKPYFEDHPLVIIIDDEEAIRQSMSVLLTEWGCQVIAARDLAEATQALYLISQMPQLLLVDKRLAGPLSGFEVIEGLREEVNHEVPAALMTGDLAGFAALKDTQNIRLLNKPVDPDVIKNLIEETGHIAPSKAEE